MVLSQVKQYSFRVFYYIAVSKSCCIQLLYWRCFKWNEQHKRLNLTFLPVHVGVYFACQEAGSVDGSVGVVCDVQERVTAAADATDALSVRVMVLIGQLRQRLLQLISITRTHTHTHTSHQCMHDNSSIALTTYKVSTVRVWTGSVQCLCGNTTSVHLCKRLMVRCVGESAVI